MAPPRRHPRRGIRDAQLRRVVILRVHVEPNVTALADAWAALHAAEDPSAVVTFDRDPFDVGWGDVTYTLPGGWKIVVFIDCGGWDYVDHIEAPDGTTFDPDNTPPEDAGSMWNTIFYWSPSESDLRWGRFWP